MVRGIACSNGVSHTVDIEVDGYLLAAEGMENGNMAAPSQYGLLLASLAACTALTLRTFAHAQHWPLDSLDVYVTLERESGDIHVDRMLFVTGLDRGRQEVLLELARRTPLTLLLGSCMSISTILL